MQRLLNLLQHWREAVPVPGISNWLLMGAVRLVDALKPAELSAAHADGAEAVQVGLSHCCQCIKDDLGAW